MSQHGLEISSAAVGARCKPLHVSLSPRRAMNYAAGLDDNNRRYFDDTRPEGILVHPMLAVALTWPLSAGLDDIWGHRGIPPEARARQVHYNESIVWHRTMAVDAHLVISGEIRAMRPHPAGTIAVLRYDAVDRNDRPVFTEHITGLLRGVTLSDGGRGCEDIPAIMPAPHGLEGGWNQAIHIGPLAAHVYDACSEISFPIHSSPAFARRVGLSGTIYQGTATLALAMREILDREGGCDPANLSELHCAFRGLVFPGGTVNLAVLGVELEPGRKTVYFEARTAAGESAIRDGRAVLKATQ